MIRDSVGAATVVSTTALLPLAGATAPPISSAIRADAVVAADVAGNGNTS